MKFNQHTLCGLIAFLAAAASGRAAMVTYSFSGVVQNPVDYSGLGYVPSAIQSGSSFAGTISFTIRLGQLDATDGYYRGTALNMSVNIVVAGQYTYNVSTPSDSDEIDIIGTSFGLYKRPHGICAFFTKSAIQPSRLWR